MRVRDGLAWVILALSFNLVGAAAAYAANSSTLLVMGDSLSAGYGIHVENGWVALLAKRLVAQGYEYQVVNASVTGETTSGGKVRLPSLLSTHKPAIVIVELGANDGLRGLPVKQMRDNLASMIAAAQEANAKVLLIGMQIPPNYGQQYTTSFRDTYAELAKTYHLKLVPFLLEGVALDAKQMQADNLHPNELGQPRLLDNVWPSLQSMLASKPSNSRRAQ